jgi:hypothetical protein
MKSKIVNCPACFWVDLKSPLYLFIDDACDYGIGAYLYQIIDGEEKPIKFLSKLFNNYKCVGLLMKKRKLMAFSI